MEMLKRRLEDESRARATADSRILEVSCIYRVQRITVPTKISCFHDYGKVLAKTCLIILKYGEQIAKVMNVKNIYISIKKKKKRPQKLKISAQ